MNEFTRIPPPPIGEDERSRHVMPIALTLAILIFGAIGIVKFTSEEKPEAESVPVAEMVPGGWEGRLELFVTPRDRPDTRVRITYSFDYRAVPSYGGNETVQTRLKVFEREAIHFVGPMEKQDLVTTGIKTMIEPALFEVLERSLFPRARGRLTEFSIFKIDVMD